MKQELRSHFCNLKANAVIIKPLYYFYYFIFHTLHQLFHPLVNFENRNYQAPNFIKLFSSFCFRDFPWDYIAQSTEEEVPRINVFHCPLKFEKLD